MNAAQREVIAAAMDRIIPPGPGPGAGAANAIGYVDWMMASGSFPPTLERLADGAALLDSLARALCGAGFAACGPEERDAVLARLQATPHPRAQRCFAALVTTSIAGFLCPPAYGGNRGGVGWADAGYLPHP